MARKSPLVVGIRASLEMITPSSTAIRLQRRRVRLRSTLPEGHIAVTHLNRSPVLILTLILLLAACGGTASSSSVTRTATAAPTATAAALVKGEFVGDAGSLAGIALSTNGRQVIAYLCDGDAQYLSLAEWFKGSVTSTGIDITNAHGAHLAATVGAQAITGTVTLKDGRSAAFTARLLPDPGRGYGLFRSEETFHGVHYLGGWIFNPPHFASARTGPGTQASEVSLTTLMVPMPVCCLPDGIRGMAIIDEQTGALIKSPPVETIASVTVPDLGTFQLTPCREAQC
jgi:hypothetical protein